MKLPEITPAMFPAGALLTDLVDAAEEHSEAHPVAIAAHFLVGFGNSVGRAPHFRVGETRHYVNEFALVVGPTGTGRKGDARHVGLVPLDIADPIWASTRVRSGLSSGEGLVYAVRDPVRGTDRKNGQTVTLDLGVDDKRLCIIETEFSQALKMFRREGNILSDTLRNSWDGSEVLGTLTKNNQAVASNAHISLVGHTTPEDLRTHLADLDVANGVANRFLFLAVNRLHLISNPPPLDQLQRRRLADRTKTALERARTVDVVERTAAAEEHWSAVYPTLTAERPGLQGALLARGPAHVMRLATLFALFALGKVVDDENLTAALAWWNYATTSVEEIFTDRTGNEVADRIKSEMISGQKLSLSRIRETIFANHVSSGRLRDGLDLLRQLGLVEFVTEETPGRSRLLVRRIDPTTRRRAVPS